MKNRIWRSLAALGLLVLASLFVEAEAHTPSESGPEKSVIERIVREYLLENPEVIEEAIGILRARQEAEREAQAKAAMVDNREALRAHPASPVSGNSEGDVTVVEFFDYQCGYCKRALGTMVDLLASDRNVRVVWKEFPILGPASRVAALAAMAADRQGRYYEFHVELMGATGQLTEARIFEIAEKTGLDLARLQHDMEDPAIGKYLDETRTLAEALGIRGTPAFVVGDRLVRGAIDAARMKELVAAARSNGDRGNTRGTAQ